MKDPADRLRELRIAKGYASAIDAARAYGWNENTYKSHENGARGMKLEAARKYARAFNSSAAYILTGDNGAHALPQISTVTTIPLVGEVAAGMFKAGNWTPSNDVDVPALPRKGIPVSAQYAVRVDGPSVNKRIADGMYAICAKLDSVPGGAEIGSLVHVVRQDGDLFEHTIKELRLTGKGVVLMPVSDHPDHQEPVALASTEESTVTIQGVVIGVFQPL